ncbi:MAG: flavodoxin family protein [Thermodesulfobacteriota bacterium]
MSDVKVKVLGLSATVIRNGNCDTAIKEALKAASELDGVQTEFISLADKKVDMCQHCQYCMEHRSRCQVKDDANEILEIMERVDAIIFGAPTWCRTVSPPLLNLFSRARHIGFFTQSLRNKVAGFITLGFLGFGLENALHVMEELTYGHGMIRAARAAVQGSAVIFGERAAYLEHGVMDDKRGMRYVKIVGQRVVELAKMIKYATAMGIVPAIQYNISTGATMKSGKKEFVKGVWRPRNAGR